MTDEIYRRAYDLFIYVLLNNDDGMFSDQSEEELRSMVHYDEFITCDTIPTFTVLCEAAKIQLRREKLERLNNI